MRASSLATGLFLSAIASSVETTTAFSITSCQKVRTTTITSSSQHILSTTIPSSKIVRYATVEDSSSTSSSSSSLDTTILSRIKEASAESNQWAEDFDLVSESGAAFHALFSGIRSSAALGLKGSPFYLKGEDVREVMMSDEDPFNGFFTFDDLAKALEDDFLDANRGSTDNRKGWKVRTGLINYMHLFELEYSDERKLYKYRKSTHSLFFVSNGEMDGWVKTN